MAYLHVHTLAGSDQVIAQGPIASQEAIKSLGTNGGGFFNANSAHPYENPTIITNHIQMVSIFAIAAALTYTFGKWVGNTKQGWMIFAVMLVLFVISLMVMTISELHGLDFYIAKISKISMGKLVIYQISKVKRLALGYLTQPYIILFQHLLQMAV